MIRSALLLCAALLAALTFACQQIPPGQPLVGRFGPIPFTSRPCSASDLGNPSDSTDLGSFASNVIMLASNFVPATLGSPPVNSPPDQVPSQVQMDLKAAFRAAPDDFRTALCGLTAVYIDPTNIYSWGYRDPTTKNRYIGLSERSLWGSAGAASPPKYSDFETQLLAQVMVQLQMPWPGPSSTLPKAPFFDPATSGDTPAMTVLAVLAHEFGHVLWYDLIKASNGDQYNPKQFTCPFTGKSFFVDSWDDVSRPNPWVGFAEEADDAHKKSGTTKITHIRNALKYYKFKTAASALNSLYDNEENGTNKSGAWTGLFGAVSPEEDFVESFKFYIMTRYDTNESHPVTSMALNLFDKAGSTPTYKPDVYADYYSLNDKSGLAAKIACVDNNSFYRASRFRR